MPFPQAVPRVQNGKGDTYSAFLALAVLTASARVRSGAVASVAGSTAAATHFGRFGVRSVGVGFDKELFRADDCQVHLC